MVMVEPVVSHMHQIVVVMKIQECVIQTLNAYLIMIEIHMNASVNLALMVMDGHNVIFNVSNVYNYLIYHRSLIDTVKNTIVEFISCQIT